MITTDLAGLAQWLTNLEKRILAQTPDARIEKAMKRIVIHWADEAKRRVPVDNGSLKQSIVHHVQIVRRGVITGEVGTNIPYAKYIEFGTDYIAKGAVKALGFDPSVTDAQAVTSWPALTERGGSGQQMPFLRPAWMAIQEWAVGEFRKEMRKFSADLKAGRPL